MKQRKYPRSSYLFSDENALITAILCVYGYMGQDWAYLGIDEPEWTRSFYGHQN